MGWTKTINSLENDEQSTDLQMNMNFWEFTDNKRQSKHTDLLVRELSFKRPLLSVDVSVCDSVILSATLELNISETRPDSGIVPMDSL